jgi:4-hydroxy-tetrahydrodipicolinate synthase
MRRILNTPKAVSEADTALMTGLLGLLSVRPNMNFVAAYKVMLSEQTGDDTWLNIRAPLHRLGDDAEQAIRQGYRALGNALQSI